MASIETRKSNRRPPPLGTVSEMDTKVVTQPMSIKIPGRNSPKPTWDQTMNDLSRGLQLICGSPAGVGPMSPGFNTSNNTPPSFSYGESPSPPVVALAPRQLAFRTHAKQLRRADSVKGHGSQLVDRTIFVRHIETHTELENRLSEICRTGTTPAGSPEAEVANAHAQTKRILFTRPFDRSVVRIQVKYPPEDLIVSVNEKRHLVVESTSGPVSGRVLHQSIVSPEVQVKQLVAYAYENGVLSIRERSAKMSDSSFNNTGSCFIPVVKQDDSKRELKISVHVPHNFRFEDIFVKTVDDRLVVVGKKRVISLPQGVALNFRSNSSVLPSFRVMFQLPPGTDSRSVCASLTKHYQLVIIGKLGPTLRRHTM